MGTARFLDRPEDLERYGLIPGVMQQREDARLSPVGGSGSEVWYFDATLDNGTKVTAGFRNKPIQACESPVDVPVMVISVTTADGKTYADTQVYAPEESYFDLEHCSCRVGPHSLEGDLVDYHLVVRPIVREAKNAAATDGMDCTTEKGVGLDLHFHALVKPFRHGAGRTIFNDDEEMYSTWFSIPKMDVTGTLTLEGVEETVHGDGYHDHRCMKLDDMKAWHHWIWGRQHFEDYTVVIFDLVSGERFGFVQVPLFAVYNKKGEIIFENNGPANCEILGRYWEEKTQKNYPTAVRFHYTSGEDSVDYTLTWQDQMEARDMYTPFPEPVRKDYDDWNLRPTYMRYNSRGDMTMNIGGKTETVTGMMIYEMAFPGKESDQAHL